MREDAETLPLDSASRFRIKIRFHDAGIPDSTHSFDCVVDTGNPDAIAVPENYEENLTRFIGEENRGGAGVKNSRKYGIVITNIGDIETEHTTACICSLRNRHSPGLIGIDLLKYMSAELYGKPEEKLLDLTLSHFTDESSA